MGWRENAVSLDLPTRGLVRVGHGTQLRGVRRRVAHGVTGPVSSKTEVITRPAESGNTGYTRAMAKVMISMPDDLLARVDAQANAHGSTRSATIRELAEAGLGERQRRLSEHMAGLEGQARGHGGSAVQDLKAGRPG